MAVPNPDLNLAQYPWLAAANAVVAETQPEACKNGMVCYSAPNQPFEPYRELKACTVDTVDNTEDWKFDNDIARLDHKGISFGKNKPKKFKITRTIQSSNFTITNCHQLSNKLEQLKIVYREKTKANHKLNNTIEIETIVKISIKRNLPWWSEELAAENSKLTPKNRRTCCAAPSCKPVGESKTSNLGKSKCRTGFIKSRIKNKIFVSNINSK